MKFRESMSKHVAMVHASAVIGTSGEINGIFVGVYPTIVMIATKKSSVVFADPTHQDDWKIQRVTVPPKSFGPWVDVTNERRRNRIALRMARQARHALRIC